MHTEGRRANVALIMRQGHSTLSQSPMSGFVYASAFIGGVALGLFPGYMFAVYMSTSEPLALAFCLAAFGISIGAFVFIGLMCTSLKRTEKAVPPRCPFLGPHTPDRSSGRPRDASLLALMRRHRVPKSECLSGGGSVRAVGAHVFVKKIKNMKSLDMSFMS